MLKRFARETSNFSTSRINDRVPVLAHKLEEVLRRTDVPLGNHKHPPAARFAEMILIFDRDRLLEQILDLDPSGGAAAGPDPSVSSSLLAWSLR